MTSIGGRAVQYSHWNGFDLTTKAGTDKLKKDLLEKKPRVVWMTPPCTTQRTQRSQSRSRFHRIQMNILVVFLWLVTQDWCETILEQMTGSTGLGRGGAFSELQEQFRSGGTPGCQWCNLADGTLSSKSCYFICSHRRWSDLLCSRRCLHGHPHRTQEKETWQRTPQLVKTVVKEIMKVESTKQIRSLPCCTMTIGSKSHLVAPAVSTEYRVIQEDAHCRPSETKEKQPEPWCLDCTWNLAILILQERSILCEENTQTDSSSLQQESSAAVLVRKVRQTRVPAQGTHHFTLEPLCLPDLQ